MSVHAQIEEEIFYPVVKAALKDKHLVPEATVDYASIKDLLAQIEGVEPDGEVYDAKIKVLAEYVNLSPAYTTSCDGLPVVTAR